MEDVAKRIKELIETLQITNKEFAERIEVAPAIISHVLSGRNNPSLNLIQQITNVYTNVNLKYLLNGEGRLIDDEKEQSQDAASISEPVYNDPTKHLPPGARYVPPPSGTPRPTIADTDKDSKEYKDLATRTVRKPSVQEEDELTNVYTNVNQQETKKVERVIIFYTDHSFREYRPEG